jgi:hypothetical protein
VLRQVASLAALVFASLLSANAERSTGPSSLYLHGDGRTWETASPLLEPRRRAPERFDTGGLAH